MKTIQRLPPDLPFFFAVETMVFSRNGAVWYFLQGPVCAARLFSFVFRSSLDMPSRSSGGIPVSDCGIKKNMKSPVQLCDFTDFTV